MDNYPKIIPVAPPYLEHWVSVNEGIQLRFKEGVASEQ